MRVSAPYILRARRSNAATFCFTTSSKNMVANWECSKERNSKEIWKKTPNRPLSKEAAHPEMLSDDILDRRHHRPTVANIKATYRKVYGAGPRVTRNARTKAPYCLQVVEKLAICTNCLNPPTPREASGLKFIQGLKFIARQKQEVNFDLL